MLSMKPTKRTSNIGLFDPGEGAKLHDGERGLGDSLERAETWDNGSDGGDSPMAAHRLEVKVMKLERQLAEQVAKNADYEKRLEYQVRIGREDLIEQDTLHLYDKAPCPLREPQCTKLVGRMIPWGLLGLTAVQYSLSYMTRPGWQMACFMKGYRGLGLYVQGLDAQEQRMCVHQQVEVS
jgi:hypothetical protein